MSKLFYATLAAVTITCASTPVLADDQAAAQTHVSLAQADFSNPSAVAKIYKNLKTQARYVCDTAASYDHDYDSRAEKTCEADAVSAAVREINHVELSQLDDQANGRNSNIQLSLNTSGR